jgi:CRP-like cAMP-binding protein
VDWFNAVDDTYRTQLRELNELNWNRFQAAMDGRFAASDLKMEQRFAGMEARLAEFEVKLERRFGDQTKWLVGVWLGTVIPIAGMILGLFNSVR